MANREECLVQSVVLDGVPSAMFDELEIGRARQGLFRAMPRVVVYRKGELNIPNDLGPRVESDIDLSRKILGCASCDLRELATAHIKGNLLPKDIIAIRRGKTDQPDNEYALLELRAVCPAIAYMLGDHLVERYDEFPDNPSGDTLVAWKEVAELYINTAECATKRDIEVNV